MAIKHAESHRGINGWFNRSAKRWKDLGDKSPADWINNPIGMVGGVVDKGLKEVLNPDTYTEGTSLEGTNLMGLNKLWRAKLLINRARSNKDKDGKDFKSLQKVNDTVNLHTTKTQSLAEQASTLKDHNATRRLIGQRPGTSIEAVKTPQLGMEGDTNFDTAQSLSDQRNHHTTRAESTAQVNSPSMGDGNNPVTLRRQIQRGAPVLGMRKEFRSEEYRGRTVGENMTSFEEKKQKAHVSQSGNSIIIVSPFTSPYQALKLQCRPDEIQVTPQSTWAAVASMGRNNPFRMYTGGEDTIQFDICWYCNDPNNRGEVVTKCRLLESWSKANGYLAAPPVLQLLWGQSNIYKDDFFILESASYKLSHFQNMAKRDVEPNSGQEAFINLGLYPNQATQTLVFKRVSSVNRTWENIVPIADLKKTQGIAISE